jgi:hypothetical protein
MCKECLTVNPLPLFAFAETKTRVFDPMHKCSKNRISQIMELNESEREKIVKDIFLGFPKEMSKAIKTWWITQTEPYLLAVKLEKLTNNAIDIARVVDDTDHWLHRSVNGGIVTLDQAKLEDFLFLAFGNTFCVVQLVRGHGELEKREAYFLVLSRNSTLHWLFCSPNQDWITYFEKYMQEGWAPLING